MIDCGTCSVLDCKFNSINPKKSCSMYKPYMTSKQALHCMKFNCELAVCEECDVYGMTGTDHCFEDACRLAIEALEKQIPKKWQYEMVNDDDTYVCPCCKEYWYMDYGTPATNEYNYCPNCGQALKWE